MKIRFYARITHQWKYRSLHVIKLYSGADPSIRFYVTEVSTLVDSNLCRIVFIVCLYTETCLHRTMTKQKSCINRT